MFLRYCLVLVLCSALFDPVVRAQEATDHDQMAYGTIAAIHDNSISVKEGKGKFLFYIDIKTSIWRGGTVDPGELRPRDYVLVRYHENNGRSVADYIEANIVNWSGTISRVAPHSVTIKREGEQGNPLGTAAIFVDNRTDFGDYSEKDLKVGGSIQAVGLDLGKHRMRAAKIITIDPPLSKTH